VIQELVLVGFAAWRMASLLVNENGPFGIFERVREAFGVPKQGEIIGFLPTLFTCIWCMTVWTSLLMWATYQVEDTIVLIIAAMSVALLVERYAH
jgi:hypothetical protein